MSYWQWEFIQQGVVVELHEQQEDWGRWDGEDRDGHEMGLFLLRRSRGWLEGIEEFDLDENGFDGEEKNGSYYERKQRRDGGNAWWLAFLTVKKRMDSYSRKRFEGYISLR